MNLDPYSSACLGACRPVKAGRIDGCKLIILKGNFDVKKGDKILLKPAKTIKSRLYFSIVDNIFSSYSFLNLYPL